MPGATRHVDNQRESGMTKMTSTRRARTKTNRKMFLDARNLPKRPSEARPRGGWFQMTRTYGAGDIVWLVARTQGIGRGASAWQ